MRMKNIAGYCEGWKALSKALGGAKHTDSFCMISDGDIIYSTMKPIFFMEWSSI